MTRRRVGLLFGLAAATAGCGRPQPPSGAAARYDLRRPDQQPGDREQHRSLLTITDGTLTVTAGGQTDVLRLTSSSEAEGACEVLAVAGRRAVAVRETVRVDREKRTVWQGGRPDTESHTSPLMGETMDWRRTGDTWACALAGKQPTPEQRKELEWCPPPDGICGWRPEQPVAVGDQWQVPVAEMRRLLGSKVRIEHGEWTVTLVGVTTVDGKPTAELREVIRLTGRGADPADGLLAAELAVSGTTRCALDGSDSASRLAGTISETAEQVENGVRVRAVIAGPVVLDITSRSSRLE